MRHPVLTALLLSVARVATILAQTPTPAPTPTPVSTNAGAEQGATETPVCTTAMTGSHRTYTVKSDADMAKVPFGTLVAGDVVNVYASATPYKTKIGLRGQGTATAPIVINGVSDESCNKPVLDFAGARTAAGSANVFNSVQYGERLGGIVVMRNNQIDNYNTYEPKFIVIQGLKITGARNGASYTTAAGAADNYASSACIWLQSSEDVTIRNNDVSDCGFGIFLMAKDDMLSQTNVRPVIVNNRVYGHGVDNSYSEHGFYVQGVNPIVTGNFIGRDRPRSLGSSYKSRSSGEVFGHNYVICTARCLDFVQSEEQANGVALQPTYGTDYVYGNTIVSNGPEAIHYGGDNRGEQNNNGVTTEVFVPRVPYRKHLRFWNNTYTLTTSTYRTWIFALSAQETQMDAWGNTFNLAGFTGRGQLSWVQYAGQVRLGPGNAINGHTVVDAQTEAGATGPIFAVTQGAPIPNDPKLATLN